MAKLIGTAGHAGHGKTTLIRALAGNDAGRVSEGKKEGKTFDIEFASVDLPGHGRVAIVDVPGHDRRLRDVVAGATGVGAALLCVAADGGVTPQTREHLQVLELLPVERLVVALTRTDLVDDDAVARTAEDVRELVEPTRFGPVPIVPVSAVTGAGLDAVRQALGDAFTGLEEVPSESGSMPWVLPIDRAFSAEKHGVVATGTLIQGLVRVGDRAVLEPGSVDVLVRAIRSCSGPIPQAQKGMRIGVDLSGVRLQDVRRGMAVGSPGALRGARFLNARVRWLERPEHSSRIRLSIGAEEASGRVFLNGCDPEIAQFRLEAPVACCRNQPLIVRRHRPPTLLGGGCVDVPPAKPARRSEKVVAVAAEDADSAIVAMLADAGDGLTTEDIARRLGQTKQLLGPVFENLAAEGRVLGFAGLWFDKQAFETGQNRFLEALSALHEKYPTRAGHPRELVVGRAGLKWSRKPLDRILARLSQDGKVVVQGALVRLAEFRVALTRRQRALLDRVAAEIESDGWSPSGPQAIADRIRVPVQAVEAILRLGVESEELRQIADDFVLLASQTSSLREKLLEVFGDRPFTAAEFRDAFGTSRKYAIPLLEYLDSQGITLRQGDVRRVRQEGGFG